MNILDAIARAVGTDQELGAAGELRAKATSFAGAKLPVLQFVPFPITLEPSQYRDALSDSNPGGSLVALAALRALVDPVPSFARDYNASASSTEQVYGLVVGSASAATDQPFVRSLIEDARRAFQQETHPNLDGTPGVWRGVQAVPHDWWDVAQAERFRELRIDLDQAAQGNDAPFVQIGGPRVLSWSLGSGALSVALDPETRIHALKMKYLLVSLRRPWLNPLLFETAGWQLSGQPEGYCSSGDLVDNAGVFPLLTTGMLVAREVSVEADWGAADQSLLASSRSSRAPLCLGPLTVRKGGADPSLQVVAFVSSLIPYAPPRSDLRAGSILLTNSGAFIARFSVTWQQGAKSGGGESGKLPALAARGIAIPADASNIQVTFDVMTMPPPLETWRTVARHAFVAPVSKSYVLTGETWSAKLQEKSAV